MGSSSFVELVASVVRAIPKGTTLSYAGVALRANKPGGARQVVKALHALTGVPWWRVIKSDGTKMCIRDSSSVTAVLRSRVKWSSVSGAGGAACSTAANVIGESSALSGAWAAQPAKQSAARQRVRFMRSSV